MNICKFTVLGAVILVSLMTAATGFAADIPEADDSVVLSNVDEPEASDEASKNSSATADSQASTPLPKSTGPEAEPGAVAESPSEQKPVEGKSSALNPMEKYKDLRVQQAATQNGVNPATARRYLRVDKATLMMESGQQ
jgi:hypothetical protein